jgi:hypothetical protein
MDNSYLNIFTFLLTTLFYYMILKPNLDYKTVSNNGEQITDTNNLFKDYTTRNYVCLAIYLLLVMVIQFIVNASIITQKCGGSISENMGFAGMLTFIPWTLIFGVMIIILVIYPGFKSAFSDVIGYYWVANEANNLLVELLVQENVEDALAKGVPDAAPTAATTNTPVNQGTLVGGTQKGGDDKQAIREVTDLILKICGNTSILINQMTPRNFIQYWSLLNPLKKKELQTNKNGTESARATQIRDTLFKLVVTRDNIGEILWYIYTGLLLTSIVQLKITTKGCAMNPKTMEENYAKFQEQEAAIQQQNAVTTATTYTVTN